MRIRRAIEKIKEQDAAMGAYLEATISTRGTCVYYPLEAEPIHIQILP
jgi:hypothetical protein